MCIFTTFSVFIISYSFYLHSDLYYTLMQVAQIREHFLFLVLCDCLFHCYTFDHREHIFPCNQAQGQLNLDEWNMSDAATIMKSPHRCVLLLHSLSV